MTSSGCSVTALRSLQGALAQMKYNLTRNYHKVDSDIVLILQTNPSPLPGGGLRMLGIGNDTGIQVIDSSGAISWIHWVPAVMAVFASGQTIHGYHFDITLVR